MIKRENIKSRCQRQVRLASNKHANKWQTIYMVGLLFLVLIILVPLIFHQHQPKKSDSKKQEEAISASEYRNALQANLDKLRQIQKQVSIVHSMKTNAIHESVVDNNTLYDNQPMQMRQHAPTEMYNNKNTSNHTPPSRTEPVLLERNIYSTLANKITHPSSVLAERLEHPNFTIAQGEFIHAILETAINSDLPGMVRATITNPVYSYQEKNLLIPSGSRLIGQYASATIQGINRIMVIWQRILLPDGISIQIDSPGSDSLGSAGLPADSVNTHFFQRFGEASLLSLIGAASANIGVDPRDRPNAAQQYRTEIARSFNSSAQQSLHQTFSIKPTLDISQGSKINVFVARDLDFSSVIKDEPPIG